MKSHYIVEKISPSVEGVLACFFPKSHIHACKAHGAGHINDTFRVALSSEGVQQEYLLQRINHHVFKQPDRVMQNIQMVYQHLQAKAFAHNLLQPQLTKEGGLWAHDEYGNFWRVFPFYAGATSPLQPQNRQEAFVTGQAFGQFLMALSDLNPSFVQETIPGFHDSITRLTHFKTAIEGASTARLSQSKLQIEFILDHQSLFYEVEYDQMPLRVVHNDAKINNILFDAGSGNLLGVIDWDTIMPGTLLADFGDLVRSTAVMAWEDELIEGSDPFRPDFFISLCQGFVPAITPILAEREKAKLHLAPLWITLEQALRFLTDYLNGDVYYKIQHPDHNYRRTINQIVVFQALMNRRTEMEETIAAYL